MSARGALPPAELAEPTPAMALVTPGGLAVPASALSWRFSRSSGPGGQHVNTAETRVELICDLDAVGFPPGLRHRLAERLPSRVRVVVAGERSQLRNREVALARLGALLDRASVRPPSRRPTRPGAAQRAKRLAAKRAHSDLKRTRRAVVPDDE